MLSLRAWNPWWIVQSSAVGDGLLSDSTPILGPLTPRQIGYLAAGVGLLGVFVAVLRRPTGTSLFLGLAASALVAFCLLTTMHERYSAGASSSWPSSWRIGGMPPRGSSWRSR